MASSPDRPSAHLRVGVIVPVHGWAPFLAEALDTVLDQEPAPDAVVVVDDGSPQPLELHPDHAPRCLLVRRDERGGPGRARATGLAELERRGAPDLVALCDADDAWAPGKLAAQLRAMRRHPEAAACFARAEVVGPDGRPTGERWDEPPPGAHPSAALLPDLYERNPLCTSGALVRRDALAGAGGFDTDLERAEDWDLWLRLVATGATFVLEPAAAVRYRRRPGALTGDVAALARAQMAVHERHAGLVGDATARRAQAADRRALAAGLVRERRFAEARHALAGAPGTRSRRALLAVPGARALLGRRDPYRRT